LAGGSGSGLRGGGVGRLEAFGGRGRGGREAEEEVWEVTEFCWIGEPWLMGLLSGVGREMGLGLQRGETREGREIEIDR